MKTAYANNTGLFRSGNTLYISGTGGKSGISAKVNDVFSDIFLIPSHNLQFSDKYRDAMSELEKKPRYYPPCWSFPWFVSSSRLTTGIIKSILQLLIMLRL